MTEKTKQKHLMVNVPAGIEDNTRIRIAGEGEAGIRGGSSGDLYVFISGGLNRILTKNDAEPYRRNLLGPNFRNHPLFQFKGSRFLEAPNF